MSNTKQSYSEKLRDPRWQRKRLEVMSRDEFTCQYCGDKASTLNVHHYEYHGDPWETPNDLLVTLCHNCHGEETNERKGWNQKLIRQLNKLHYSTSEIALLGNSFENLFKSGFIKRPDMDTREDITMLIIGILNDAEFAKLVMELSSKYISEKMKK